MAGHIVFVHFTPTLTDTVFGRYPVERFDTRDSADDAAAALQLRVEELAEAAYAKHHWNDEDEWLATSNPRFFVVAEEELPRPEQIRVREQLARLRGSVAETPSLEEASLRFYLPWLQGTLEQVREVEPSNAQVVQNDQPTENQPLTLSTCQVEVMPEAASKTKSRSKKTPPPEPTRPQIEVSQGHPIWVTNPVLYVRIVGGDPLPPRAAEPPCIIYYGDRCYQIGDHRPVVLSEQTDNVLQAFLERPAMDEQQLMEKSGCEDAVKILRQLQTWEDSMFAPAISMPGGKNRGGYHVRVRKA